MIKEYQVNLTKEQEQFIEWVVNGEDFPLFSWFSDTAAGIDGGKKINPIFAHTLRTRGSDHTKDVWGTPNSDYVERFEGIFKDFCKENNIKWDRILRSAVNFTTHQPKDSECFIHRDHEFPHRNFLMYLNEWTSGETQFFDDERRLIKIVHPQKYKAVVSDSELHTQGYCDPHQRRVVLVVTFN
tara:strand:- start:222 stop:773 length:552 start_codon:yes stop_codon:yes gene_type:complete